MSTNKEDANKAYTKRQKEIATTRLTTCIVRRRTSFTWTEEM